MDMAGINQNLQGAARPENAAALLTQIKQANVPLETYKRRLYKYVEDVGKIWQEFYTSYYSTERVIVDENGEEVRFTGTEFKNLVLNTSIDVGPSTQWSEITSFQMLTDMWNMGIIQDPNEFIKRLPKNSFLEQDELVDETTHKQIVQMIVQAIAPQASEQLMQMKPTEMMQAIGGMINEMQSMQQQPTNMQQPPQI